MLHHLSFAVSNLSISGSFDDGVLGALGYRRVFESQTALGYGLHDGQDQFCLKLRSPAVVAGAGFHLAFAAASRSAVEAFYRCALATRGQDNGPPGLRPQYGPHYYAAFVIDPDGYRLEAVINLPC